MYTVGLELRAKGQRVLLWKLASRLVIWEKDLLIQWTSLAIGRCYTSQLYLQNTLNGFGGLRQRLVASLERWMIAEAWNRLRDWFSSLFSLCKVRSDPALFWWYHYTYKLVQEKILIVKTCYLLLFYYFAKPSNHSLCGLERIVEIIWPDFSQIMFTKHLFLNFHRWSFKKGIQWPCRFKKAAYTPSPFWRIQMHFNEVWDTSFKENIYLFSYAGS